MKTPQEIKKALECCRCTYCPKECPYYDECKIGSDTVITDFKQYVQMLETQVPRWIPVTERLPEVCGSYIVTIKQKYSWQTEWEYHVDVAEYGGNYIDDMWDTYVDWIEGQETHVTHWMPLPGACEEVSE